MAKAHQEMRRRFDDNEEQNYEICPADFCNTNLSHIKSKQRRQNHVTHCKKIDPKVMNLSNGYGYQCLICKSKKRFKNRNGILIHFDWMHRSIIDDKCTVKDPLPTKEE